MTLKNIPPSDQKAICTSSLGDQAVTEVAPAFKRSDR
jgi:hypothetical protein